MKKSISPALWLPMLFAILMALAVCSFPVQAAAADKPTVTAQTGIDASTKDNPKPPPSKYDKDMLLYLCEKGTPQQIEEAIKAGADVNAKTRSLTTPLMYAAAGNSVEVVNMLIQAGADVNAQDFLHHQTPLMWAGRNNKKHEFLKILNALIKAGADVNAKDRQGATPLMEYRTNPEALKVLIKAGADVNVKDNEGRTLLNYVAENGKSEIVSLLLKAGAVVSANDLQLAQNNEHLKNDGIIKELQRKLK